MYVTDQKLVTIAKIRLLSLIHEVILTLYPQAWHDGQPPHWVSEGVFNLSLLTLHIIIIWAPPHFGTLYHIVFVLSVLSLRRIELQLFKGLVHNCETFFKQY